MATKPNVYKLGLVQVRPQFYDGSARTHEMVWWFQGAATGNFNSTALKALQTAIDTQAASWFSNWAASPWQYLGTIITDWSSNTGITVGESATGSVNGTATGEAPPNVAGLVSANIGVRYRGGHGRAYVPGISTQNITGGNQISSTPHTNLQNYFNAVLSAALAVTSANGGPFEWCIYRNRNNPATAQAWPVQAWTAQTLLATQRRRLRKAAHR